VEVTAAAAVPDDADGSVPEHLDIAGVADVEKPGGWRTRGCSGFGARLLADFAVGFRS
jgi:leucyl aminopeptidase